MFFPCNHFLFVNICYCSSGEEDEIILNVECHYAQAKVDSCVLNIGDCAYMKVSWLRFLCFLDIRS